MTRHFDGFTLTGNEQLAAHVLESKEVWIQYTRSPSIIPIPPLLFELLGKITGLKRSWFL